MVVCGMVKERVLVVGLGEVGRPLFELLRESGSLRFTVLIWMLRKCGVLGSLRMFCLLLLMLCMFAFHALIRRIL
jgi:hypothetical protein